MNEINILDCTLRDGGYVNNWCFGKNNIDFIIKKIKNANIDYIEVGYYTEKKEYDDDYTQYNDLINLNKKLCDPNRKYIVMINYSEVDIKNIPEAHLVPNIYGIRIAFHKKNVENALKYCQLLIKKGYRIFIQPMVTMNYNYKELKYLIENVNMIKPYAFYFVDSFGTMQINDVIEKINTVDSLLNKNIILGFHSHNNLQMSYINILEFIKICSARKVIIDSSIYGIGRGAGNLNTELIANYLNDSYYKNYNIDSLLEVIDKYLLNLRKENYWGYSIEYYLSAKNNCHPNYSKYFLGKYLINMTELNQLLNMLEDDKKPYFNEEYADEIYILYRRNHNKKILIEGGEKNENSSSCTY